MSTLELQDGSGASGDAGDVELDMGDGDEEERMESGRSAWAQELRDPGTRGSRIR